MCKRYIVTNNLPVISLSLDAVSSAFLDYIILTGPRKKDGGDDGGGGDTDHF